MIVNSLEGSTSGKMLLMIVNEGFDPDDIDSVVGITDNWAPCYDSIQEVFRKDLRRLYEEDQ